ncbi:MAG TPA: protein-glutamate O-methyltransferase CheR [Polyangiaceae bacterium]|nr:protein-glutamate O-methyltransferase CheR [Polyangiaceae bacterium]
MLTERDQRFVEELLSRHAGLALTNEQGRLVSARLTSLAKQRNLTTADELIEALRRAPVGALLDSVIEALTTHETSFFRDQQPFVALSEHVIPELIESRRVQRSLSIWSAACSTGQEPYSVAMLLQERFPALASWQVRIWGTDVSQVVVQRARAGTFTEREVQRGISKSAREKYFERSGELWRVREPIRRMVSWQTFNLAAPWPTLSTFDIILMRNVLIYFSAETRARILAQTAAQLTPDGYLLLGNSETTFGVCDELHPRALSATVVYRKSSR